VRVKHVKLSAVKISYNIKRKTLQLLGDVYNRRCLVRLCIYFLYCVCGDRIKYNFLFGKQAGWGMWNSCEKNFSVRRKINLWMGSSKRMEWSGGGR
jgi:hypothetical protein